jgi:uncharacterized protein (DUF924 family)
MQTTPDTPADAQADVDFWREAGRARWFQKDDGFDADFRQRFATLHESAAAGRLDAWLGNPWSALALVLLLDQYPRNAYRGTVRMYATDTLARTAATHALDAGHDRVVGPDLCLFFYLPFAHSERLADQDRSVALNAGLGAEALSHAEGHRDIVRRFGRFPHRNRLLGRDTTPQEQAFLDEGGFQG